LYDPSVLADRFYSEGVISIGFQYPSDDTFEAINTLIEIVLSGNDRLFLLDTALTAVREIIFNAVKANLKRVYFRKLSLDINDPSDYSRGMEGFRDIANDFSLLHDELASTDRSVIFRMARGRGKIVFEIINNSEILKNEMERITVRIRKARECSNFAEAYETAYDPSEGAGLGIILIMLLMRNDGIDPENFSVSSKSGKAVSVFTLPLEVKKAEITTAIKEKILDDIDTLPTFPENIMELQALCGQHDVSFDLISSKIMLDPSLAAEVLKTANTAGFITSKRIDSINEAVIIIGLKNLRMILMASASRKIISRRFKRFEQVWDHCTKTASLARFMAIHYGLARIADSAFVAGLLHDMGKIVILSADQALMEKISDITGNRRLRSSTILEEVAIGISHSEIGAMMAKKWNFPEDLVDALKNHHSPLLANKRNSAMVMIVYLANILTMHGKKGFNPHIIESQVMDRFGLKRDRIAEELKKIMDRFERMRSR
jgi:putative nucleotidyltransferase with HDIG domain